MENPHKLIIELKNISPLKNQKNGLNQIWI